MIRHDTKNGEFTMHVNDFIGSLPRIRCNGPILKGHSITANRSDGRKFSGTVEATRQTVKGTLIVIRQDDGSMKSVYRENLTDWMTVSG
jgi:hypothetical protein